MDTFDSLKFVVFIGAFVGILAAIRWFFDRLEKRFDELHRQQQAERSRLHRTAEDYRPLPPSADVTIVYGHDAYGRTPTGSIPKPKRTKWVEPADGLKTLTAPILVDWLAHLGWNRESLRATPFGVIADFAQDSLPGTVAELVAGKLRVDTDYRRRFRANGRTQKQIEKRLREFRKRVLPKLAAIKWRE